MPICFQLIRDGEPASPSQVDEEICRHFGEEPHPKWYYHGWYDCVGGDLAAGKSFDEIRAFWTDCDPRLVEIADWIEQRSEVRHWYETRSHPRST